MKKVILTGCLALVVLAAGGCGAKRVETEEMTTLHAPAEEKPEPTETVAAEATEAEVEPVLALDRSQAEALQEIDMEIGEYHDKIEKIVITDEAVEKALYEDERLAALRQHLETVTYNLEPGRVGAVTEPDSLYVYVSKLSQLPSDYVPEDLREPEVAFSFSGANMKRNMRDDAATALEGLVAASVEEGLAINAVSGYRSYDRQDAIYSNNVANRGVEATDEVSARPGHSEHQTGLAMDVSTAAVGNGLVESFYDTPEGTWLKDNAHKFGFIIRYPKDYISNTGYNYEPWHIRYIGEDVAGFMYENDLTLEMVYATYLQD